MNEQLEPCPFCGHAMMYFGDDCSWNVFDTNIRCPVQPSLLHNLETREAAIAAWNTRAPVESGTVSGERVRRLVGWHPPGRPGDTCMPKYEVVPAPPLSPVTPSAERMPPREHAVPVRFAFDSWQRDGKPINQTEEGVELSMGDFHGGTVFNGTLQLDAEDLEELRRAIEAKAWPTFLVFEFDVPSPASVTPSVTVETPRLDELLSVFAKLDYPDDEDCWTEPARQGLKELAALKSALSLPRAPAKETTPLRQLDVRAFMEAIFGNDYSESEYLAVWCYLGEQRWPAGRGGPRTKPESPRSAVEAEVVEAAKAVHEAGSVLARHFNGPFAVWTAWNVACETLDRALARAQEGRGT